MHFELQFFLTIKITAVTHGLDYISLNQILVFVQLGKGYSNKPIQNSQKYIQKQNSHQDLSWHLTNMLQDICLGKSTPQGSFAFNTCMTGKNPAGEI